MSTLLDISKETMKRAQEQDDFSIEDYSIFGSIVEKLEEINDLDMKPHLIIWNLNVWNVFYDHIVSALEQIGYEYVGNMDLNESEYNFDCSDEVYDKLFRYKDKKCDYTNTLRIKLD